MKITTTGNPPHSFQWHDQFLQIPGTDSGRANGRTHAVCVSASGRIFLFHQAVPSVVEYDAAGKFRNSWGVFPGAHGMTLSSEPDGEFLWLTDENHPVVVKCDLEGRVCQSISVPRHTATPEIACHPTWVATNPEGGDVWVADGYGAGVVHCFDAGGRLLGTIDGREGAGRFNCPHGIAFSLQSRKPELFVADRGNRRVQVYSGDGTFLRTFGEDFLSSPDGFAFAPGLVLIPELFGRATLCDSHGIFLTTLGGNESACDIPEWPEIDRSLLTPGRFNSPHGACFDNDGNIFVVEWLVGGRVTKLERIA